MISTAIIKAVAAVLLAASVQPAAQMAEVEAAEHVQPCRACKADFDEAALFDGYCPDCLERYQDGPWCDCCGELLCGSDEWIVCDCHGIHGAVCEECAEWHVQFE